MSYRFEWIKSLYLLYKCGENKKSFRMYFFTLIFILGPTGPNSLMGYKMPNDLVKISVKDACTWGFIIPLQWRHNGRDGVSNHQPRDSSLSHLYRRGSKKTSRLCVIGLCTGNSPVTGEYHAQMASNAENVSIWLRHHESIGSKSQQQGVDHVYNIWIFYTSTKQAVCVYLSYSYNSLLMHICM